MRADINAVWVIAVFSIVDTGVFASEPKKFPKTPIATMRRVNTILAQDFRVFDR